MKNIGEFSDKLIDGEFSDKLIDFVDDGFEDVKGAGEPQLSITYERLQMEVAEFCRVSI
jgi:hypothetical protein